MSLLSIFVSALLVAHTFRSRGAQKGCEAAFWNVVMNALYCYSPLFVEIVNALGKMVVLVPAFVFAWIVCAVCVVAVMSAVAGACQGVTSVARACASLFQ